MPSQLHDAVIDLFRDKLQLAPALLHERFGLRLHPGKVQVEDSALSKNNPATLHPDLVLVVTLSGTVERWAAKARSFGHPGHLFAPLVLGPSSQLERGVLYIAVGRQE